VLDVFKLDESFMENEDKYKQLKKGNYIFINSCICYIS